MWRVCSACLIVLAAAQPLQAINIQIDYTYDTQNFFADPIRRQALEAAASVYEEWLTDNLAAITPTGSNTWSLDFPHPGNGSSASVFNPTVPANTVFVYAGGQDLPGQTLGQGGPGGYTASGFQAFFDQIELRGQGPTTGASAVDFAPWGGAITFDTLAAGSPRNWWFDLNSLPSGGASDFYSVALHELGHLLGFGTSESFDNRVNNGNFMGVNAASEYGGPVPLADDSHWRDAIEAISTETGLSSQTVMDPIITTGSRLELTYLDLAGFRDVGWTLANRPRTLAGDVNGDRMIGIPDFGILRQNFNQSNRRRSQGDLNGDFHVDISDFAILRNNFGKKGAIVPELGSGLSAAAAGATLLLFFRRR